jgi:DMSO/TMAO reductase YedYZ molybdopterin-dependent catalytic subunit
VEHGAPLRLLVPVKLGLKNIKAITRITFTKDEPRILQDLERVGGQESRIAGTGATLEDGRAPGVKKIPTLSDFSSRVF